MQLKRRMEEAPDETLVNPIRKRQKMFSDLEAQALAEAIKSKQSLLYQNIMVEYHSVFVFLQMRMSLKGV